MEVSIKLGSTYLGHGRTRFLVWAPRAEKVDLLILSPQEKRFSLTPGHRGYFHAVTPGVEPGCLYYYRLDGAKDRPDPASRFQPQGVHGPSQVVAPDFPGDDRQWLGLPLRDYIIYELHVGTFTAAGTFDAVIPYLDGLKELGVTALELMPVAQFPGERNWGYDGVFPFAVQQSYGGPEGLRRLVQACHQRGLAVILDVVYNHVGPEGNYLGDFGPYFTRRYRTPWGEAMNFDGPGSDEVRRYCIDNALEWITDYHIDALRLDALHAILDCSPQPFLAELADAVHREAERLGRRVYLMAESDLNDVRLLRSREMGGMGLDAHWNDDFHHALHTLLTGEESGYYQDFGRLEHLVKAYRAGFIYSGQYSPYRQRRHGSSSQEIAAHRLVVFAQNHDQVGNRPRADRLSRMVSWEALKLAAGAVLLSPFIPLLFMGEEYGEIAPFFYFVSHSDPDLIDAVRRGRKEEFAAFHWLKEPPDPQAEDTFQEAKINHYLRREGKHKLLLAFHQELLRLRRELASLTDLGRSNREVWGEERAKVLMLQSWGEEGKAVLLLHFGEEPLELSRPWPGGAWEKRLDSAARRWGGPGSRVPETFHATGDLVLSLSPQSCLLLVQRENS
ncbi:MAG: malto-oligosyltrehalose trehalohydrolase [Thermodesulfobacteriota bacterium]